MTAMSEELFFNNRLDPAGLGAPYDAAEHLPDSVVHRYALS